jgi:hypothetical protein
MRPVHDLGPAIDTFTFAIVEPVGVADLHVAPPTPAPLDRGRPHARQDRRGGNRSLPRRPRTRVSVAARVVGDPHIGGELHRPKPGNGTDPARFYTPQAYRGLSEVERAYDPENLIRANHPILPRITLFYPAKQGQAKGLSLCLSK